MLSPQCEQYYLLRERPHKYQLPDHAAALTDKTELKVLNVLTSP